MEPGRPVNKGLYGESEYPPMFDDEPPPLDDNEDDDGFGNFATFDNAFSTKADDNWSSWSTWSSSSPSGGHVVTEFRNLSNSIDQKSDEHDKASITNGFESNGDFSDFGTFNNADENFSSFSKASSSVLQKNSDTTDLDKFSEHSEEKSDESGKEVYVNNGFSEARDKNSLNGTDSNHEQNYKVESRTYSIKESDNFPTSNGPNIDPKLSGEITMSNLETIENQNYCTQEVNNEVRKQTPNDNLSKDKEHEHIENKVLPFEKDHGFVDYPLDLKISEKFDKSNDVKLSGAKNIISVPSTLVYQGSKDSTDSVDPVNESEDVNPQDKRLQGTILEAADSNSSCQKDQDDWSSFSVSNVNHDEFFTESNRKKLNEDSNNEFCTDFDNTSEIFVTPGIILCDKDVPFNAEDHSPSKMGSDWATFRTNENNIYEADRSFDIEEDSISKSSCNELTSDKDKYDTVDSQNSKKSVEETSFEREIQSSNRAVVMTIAKDRMGKIENNGDAFPKNDASKLEQNALPFTKDDDGFDNFSNFTASESNISKVSTQFLGDENIETTKPQDNVNAGFADFQDLGECKSSPKEIDFSKADLPDPTVAIASQGRITQDISTASNQNCGDIDKFQGKIETSSMKLLPASTPERTVSSSEEDQENVNEFQNFDSEEDAVISVPQNDFSGEKTGRNRKPSVNNDDDFDEFQDFDNKESGVLYKENIIQSENIDNSWSNFGSGEEATFNAISANKEDQSSVGEIAKLDDIDEDFDDFQDFSIAGSADSYSVKLDNSKSGRLTNFGTEKETFSSLNQKNESSCDKIESLGENDQDFDEFQDFNTAEVVVSNSGKASDKTVNSWAEFSKAKETPPNIASSNLPCETSTDKQEHKTKIPEKIDEEFDDFKEFDKGEGPTSHIAKESTDSKDDSWATFSSAKSTSNRTSSFASFSSDQNENSNESSYNWAAFGSADAESSTKEIESNESHTPALASSGFSDGAMKKKLETKKSDEDFGNFGQAQTKYSMLPKAEGNFKPQASTSKFTLLLKPSFPKPKEEPAPSCEYPNLESFVQDIENQRTNEVWGKLALDEEAERGWNIGYNSSMNFKWMLVTMSVTFENVTKKWKHSSRDTLSSLSPASSVTSFDTDSVNEHFGILLPEPAGKLTSLLKPTLLAQSQQKDIELPRVPSISSLKKGDSGSDSTSETASLDLDFFSSGLPSAASSLPSKDLASGLDLFDVNLGGTDVLGTEQTAKSESSIANFTPSKQETSKQQQQRGDSNPSSFPFNLEALNKMNGKEDMSTEAKSFLQGLENLKFMTSSVLMFPSHFSGDE